MQKLRIDANTWAELSQLLDAALDQPAAQREQWIGTLASRLDALKPHLRELLARAGQIETDGFLNTLPKLELVDSEVAQSGARVDQAGDVIGPYRLIRELGSGGMGAVWLAERTDGLISRPVALKLPHGIWRRAGLAERMAREREILATLNHPNIAHLYDAGLAADGQPYLALEYVEGQPIDEHCRDRQLDVNARLRLFAQVANAVAYAHGNLVVHRDLKPANILVTAAGQVLLLDFGIAKLLQEGQAQETKLTGFSGRALTPDYASPEQILGKPLTTASDVYSLGVILYELLSGARPYKLKRDSRGALEEAILQAEPSRPSEVADKALRKLLKGDLDTIVAKALKKQPEERYPTVHALIDDIERHLGNRPVLAQPDSSWYRLTKFVARNRLAVGAAAAIGLAVFAGAAIAVWQARVALAEKQRAEEVKEFITSIFEDVDPYLRTGDGLSAVDLLKQAKAKIDGSGALSAELRVELLNVVGSSLMSLEDFDAAEPVLLQAVKTSGESLDARHPETLRARVMMAQIHRYRGRAAEARAELDQVVPVLRERAAIDVKDLVVSLESQAMLAIDEGKYDAAVSIAREATELSTLRLGERHAETAASSIILALAYVYAKQPQLALEAAELAQRRALAAHGSKHPRIIEATSVYGRALGEAGQLGRGIEQLERAAAGAAEVFGPASMMAGIFTQNLVGLQLQFGQIKQAISNSDKGFEIIASHSAPDSYNHAGALYSRGAALVAARRGTEALAPLSSALETFKTVLGPAHAQTSKTHVNRALALAYMGKLEEARQQIDPIVSAQRASRDASLNATLYAEGFLLRLAGNYSVAERLQMESMVLSQANPKAKVDAAKAATEVGLNHVELGQLDEAAQFLEKALALFKETQPQVTPPRADALVGLGRVHLGRGRPTEAYPLLQAADTFWNEFDADNRWAGEAALWLGRCYLALGRSAEARAALGRADKILTRSAIPTDIALLKLARKPSL
jgi:tetratricopeptide (TPR) repeat protein